jgi:hypothetical protein
MKARVAGIAVLAAALAGCGSKPLTNERLASDLATKIGSTSTFVCWKRVGKLGQESAMGYDRVCGISRSRPSIYIRTGITTKPGWCLVTPRFVKAPRCPL